MEIPEGAEEYAQSIENNAAVEASWAAVAFKHAETYFNLLKALPDPRILRLTKYV